MWVAPMTSTRAGGTMACRNTSPSGVTCSSLSPLSKRLADRSVGARVVALEHLAPAVGEARAHHQAAAAGAGIDGAVEQRQARRLVEALDEHADLAAAGQADLPGRLVGDAEVERLGLAAGEDVLGLRDHLALHAAARDGALEAAVRRHHHLAPDADRRRAPGADHGGERDATFLVEPVARRTQHVVGVGLLHGRRRVRTWQPGLHSRCGRGSGTSGAPPAEFAIAGATIDNGGAECQRRRRLSRVAAPNGRSFAYQACASALSNISTMALREVARGPSLTAINASNACRVCRARRCAWRSGRPAAGPARCCRRRRGRHAGSLRRRRSAPPGGRWARNACCCRCGRWRAGSMERSATYARARSTTCVTSGFAMAVLPIYGRFGGTDLRLCLTHNQSLADQRSDPARKPRLPSAALIITFLVRRLNFPQCRISAAFRPGAPRFGLAPAMRIVHFQPMRELMSIYTTYGLVAFALAAGLGHCCPSNRARPRR